MAQNFSQYTIPEPPPAEVPIVPSDKGAILQEGEFSSPNYVPGMKGWSIDSEGNADFAGDLTATSIIAASGTINPIFNGTAGENLSANDIVYIDTSGYVKRVGPTAFNDATYDSTVAEPSTANYHRVYPIDETRTLHLYGGKPGSAAAFKARIGTVNATEDDITYGTEWVYGNNVTYFDACEFTTNKFYISFYVASGGAKGIVLDVGTGTTITPGTEVNITGGGHGGGDNATWPCAEIDSTHVGIVYMDTDGKGFVEVVTISGTTITQNTGVQFCDGNGSLEADMIYLDTNKLLLVYQASGDGTEILYGRTVSISGTTPTLNTAYQIDGAATYTIGKMARISASKVAAIIDYNSVTDCYAMILSISSDVVSAPTNWGDVYQVATTEPFPGSYANILVISPTILLTAVYKNAGSDIAYHLMSVDGTAITALDTYDGSTAGAAAAASWIFKLAPYVYVGIIGNIYTLIQLSDNQNRFIGATVNDALDTASVKVSIRYNVVDTFSGLTVGSPYYIGDDGRATLTSSLLSDQLGIATSATSMLIQ